MVLVTMSYKASTKGWSFCCSTLIALLCTIALDRDGKLRYYMKNHLRWEEGRMHTN